MWFLSVWRCLNQKDKLSVPSHTQHIKVEQEQDDHNEHPHSDRGRVQQLWNPARQMLPGSPALGVGNVLGLDPFTRPWELLSRPIWLLPGLSFPLFGKSFYANLPSLATSEDGIGEHAQLGGWAAFAICLLPKGSWGGGVGIQRYLYISSSHNHF